ncbi:MAG: pseudouridine synthase [Bacteroidales bacterium]|nr:pseudouridine synthase [Bacteroidales bacterium]HOK97765.1 pseudouridine synthase [Bacteroidales bacterium]HPO64739.1 pseudouridine synthase [Bacteroidales bacterium]
MASLQYFIVYKPYLMLSQFTAGEGQVGLSQLDYHFPPDVYPVGRLDADSEGLLLLTNDKRIIGLLFDEKHPHPRTYLVQVEGIFSEKAQKELEKGVIINLKGKRYLTKPAKVEILTAEPELPPRIPPIRYRKNIPTSWIKVTLWEGKNRQVRRMTAAVGFPTLRLVRIAIGNIELGNLLPGQVKSIEAEKIRKLLNL